MLEMQIKETVIIPLTQGQETVVDAEDADLAEVKWCAGFFSTYGGGGRFVAMRGAQGVNGKWRTELMHRVILARMLGRELKRGEHVDHINGDPLDNRRANLRIASPAENCRNQGVQNNNTSGVRGVSWNKAAGKWRAQIMFNRKQIYLGNFDSLDGAREAREKAELELFGEFSPLLSRSET